MSIASCPGNFSGAQVVLDNRKIHSCQCGRKSVAPTGVRVRTSLPSFSTTGRGARGSGSSSFLLGLTSLFHRCAHRGGDAGQRQSRKEQKILLDISNKR